MIVRKASLAEIPNEQLRGGSGRATMLRYFAAEALEPALHAFNVVTLSPGTSIGAHRHEGTGEVYLLLEGRGVAVDDGAEVEVGPGDAVLTRSGHTHGLRNTGAGPLRFLAVLVPDRGPQAGP